MKVKITLAMELPLLVAVRFENIQGVRVTGESGLLPNDRLAETIAPNCLGRVENELLFSDEGWRRSVVAMYVNKNSANAAEPMDAKRGRKRFNFNGRKVWHVISSAVVAGCALLAVALIGARLLGLKSFTVLSGSMEPNYPVGSMIFVQPKDYKELQIGDTISFVANENGTVVTHRIADIAIDENDPNTWRFKTKGDANDTADAKLVHYKNVIGTPIVTIPMIGYVANNVQQPPGIYITLVVGTLLLAWTFLPGTLEGRRKTARKSIA